MGERSLSCPCSSSTTDQPTVHLAFPLPSCFSLHKAVCSYGFFMTAPNSWLPAGTLYRPLRLPCGQVVLARICQSSPSHGSLPNLHVCLGGILQLSDAEKDCILAQVRRMLRLSEMDSSAVAAFHALHPQAKEEGFGRLFRSPYLFEDMVKSLLLCNCGSALIVLDIWSVWQSNTLKVSLVFSSHCRWGRTLSMARALCELQAELKGPPLGAFSGTSKQINNVVLPPQTPEGRELKRKRNTRKREALKACQALEFTRMGDGEGFNVQSYNPCDFCHLDDKIVTDSQSGTATGNEICSLSQTSLLQIGGSCEATSTGTMALSHSDMTAHPDHGDFPSPEEIVGLDVNFLAKRCGLGYRAKRIWKLAKDICEGTIDLNSFEAPRAGELQVEDVKQGLLQLQGFGPYTCANVLMCLGEYSIVPADTETVRHLKQVHGRSSCTTSTVSREVAEVYARFAPFQFLAYWFELWGCYEKKFGQLSCMDPKDYGLITGHNMRNKSNKNEQSITDL